MSTLCRFRYTLQVSLYFLGFVIFFKSSLLFFYRVVLGEMNTNLSRKSILLRENQVLSVIKDFSVNSDCGISFVLALAICLWI